MEADLGGIPLAVSVVIPTKNRADLLERFLPSLAEQAVSERYEVIVVDNGSTDETSAVVERASGRWPHIRRIIEDKPGSAWALDRGAREARAPILIFVDDDMLAAPDLIAHHLWTHREHPGGCALGHVLSAPSRRPFDRMQAYIFDGVRVSLANRSPAPSDFWSGNVSLPRELYFRFGGYDKKFGQIGYGKDHDFGKRLLDAGIELRFVPEALTYHHFTERFRDRLKKNYRVGIAYAYLKEIHHDFLIEAECYARGSLSARVIVWLCRLAAALMEPFAFGEGRPATPLAFVYDAGLRAAIQHGVADYGKGYARVTLQPGDEIART